MTDPIGTAQERELIEAIVVEANSWSMTKPNRAHKLRAAADALQSRIAEVERLTEALDLARNRLRAAAINEAPTQSKEYYEYSQWADEADAALSQHRKL